MEKRSFNNDWTYYREGLKKTKITLPHDAMIFEKRSLEAKGGTNISYFEGYKYIYEKEFVLEDGDNNKDLFLEFEGIYHNARIFINDREVLFKPYGYTDFFVEITPYVDGSRANRIKVIADNSDQPNSRWYTGSGIYRDVWLYSLPKDHLLLNGIRVKTVDFEKRKIAISLKANTTGKAKIQIKDQNKVISSRSVDLTPEGEIELELKNAELWDPDHPKLYECEVAFGNDVRSVTFGIRTVSWGEEGLKINGERVILKGACIHHDNGLLGAVCHPYAEERKVRLLKEAGYNAIRSAHNPCSKALLDACDRLGMLMMDEYVDCWYIHKTQNDYATYVEQYWKQDLLEMVEKDYNHPSVILYSTGNEVSETAQKKGIALTKEFTEYLHGLDDTRPVTCGINIFFNFLSSIGFGVYTDKKAEKNAKASGKKKKKAVGSEFFNNLAGKLGAGFMKRGATLHGCDVKTRDSFANMDIAGYNYGILRYRHDLKKYPDRLILGSETFCSDAYKFFEMAKENPRIIGDFVWAGMDYIGEVGVGSWTVADYAKDFDHSVGWLTAGSGRIDITGKMTSEVDYTRVAFGLDIVKMGVIPVPHHKMKHSPSSWKYSRAEASWTYEGCEGMETKVEVYARAHSVSLFLNDQKIGSKRLKNRCDAEFITHYYPGVLKAVAYDEQKNVLGECILKTGKEKTVLTAVPEEPSVRKEDLVYIRYQYTDGEGTVKTLARGDIEIVSVKNGVLRGFGNACSYNDRGYTQNVSDTFYGEALAIFSPKGIGKMKVEARSKYGDTTTVIEIKE